MPLVARLNLRPAVTGFPAGAGLGPRTIADFEFVWMISGNARWHWLDGGVELNLEPQTLLLVRPGMRHEFVWDRRRYCRHGFVHFQVDSMPDTEHWPLSRPITPPGPIGGLLDYLLWLAEEPTPSWRHVTERTLATILEFFVRDPLPDAADYREAEPAPLATALDHVRREWNQRGMRPISMAELVSAAAVSREHLTRLFRSRYGFGIIGGLEQVRLARAANLLTRSNLPIGEIAHSCGFADPLHFSRRFRLTYGRSPRAYRKAGNETAPLGTGRLLRLAHRLRNDRLAGPLPVASPQSPAGPNAR